MCLKLIAWGVVFGLVASDPLPRLSTSANDISLYRDEYYQEEDNSLSLLDLFETTEQTSLIAHVVSFLFDYKTTALSLVVSAISWLISHSFVVLLGAVTTVGFCKLTGKCNMEYGASESISSLRSMVTPERLDKAEKFLVRAIEKYSDKSRKTVIMNKRERLS